ncbi:MAG: DUF1573 domain-containing protein [Odoribacteraceae bacterium]|jgi:hypothetical protein|nr:DUF1573 domain-containing protein [Odoribacteraceae bacterium]
MIQKIFFYMIAGTLLLHACKGKEGEGGGEATRAGTVDSTKLTRVELSEKLFDFGNIARGEIVGHTFHVKNAGEKDLIIQEILSSCGCTTASYTRRPIRPGESGTVEVKFDSADKTGKQYKIIHVYSNVRGGLFELVVKANILN